MKCSPTQQNEKFINFVRENKKKFIKIKSSLRMFLIMTTNELSGNTSNNDTINELINFCSTHNIDYILFSNENKFIEYSMKNLLERNGTYLIYNQSFSGPIFARRILIPAFCSYNSLDYTGNDAYRMGLLCDKFHYYSILKNAGIPIADFWYYHYNYGWITDNPTTGLRVIMKASNENNKISIDENSVFTYSRDFEEPIHDLSAKYNQGVVLQKFINGYEATVPTIIHGNNIYTPNVLGLRHNNASRSGDYFVTRKDFITFPTEQKRYFNIDNVNQRLQPLIKDYAHQIVKVLGIRGLTRIDLRFDDSGGVFFNDVGSMPAITSNGDFTTIYEQNGLSYEDFIITTICISL